MEICMITIKPRLYLKEPKQTEFQASVLTCDCDFSLAELAAGLVGGLAQVIARILSGGGADLQARCSIAEADPGVAA